MKWAFVFLGLVAGGVAIYLLAAWAQRQGWVNFKGSGGGVTAGMAEVGRVFDPPTRHVQAVREEKPNRDEGGEGEPPKN